MLLLTGGDAFNEPLLTQQVLDLVWYIPGRRRVPISLCMYYIMHTWTSGSTSGLSPALSGRTPDSATPSQYLDRAAEISFS